jgi:hypothetical protein
MFKCEKCNYITDHKGNFNKHMKSNKHTKSFLCECGKSYSYRQGFHRHKLECIYKKEKTEDSLTVNTTNTAIEELIQENVKLSQTIREMIPRIGHKINFNLFLNEKCKDAIILTDFIKNLEITMEDIEMCPQKGIINSISDTLVNALSNLDIYERPIHCSDKKRSTLYIKDNDKWDKDREQIKIKQVIDDISYKQFVKFKEWLKSNPDDELNLKVLHHITSDISEDKTYKKIINQLSQEIYVNEIE